MRHGRIKPLHVFGLLLASAGGLAASTALEAQSSSATTIGRADLRALNGSGAKGQVELRLSSDDRTLTVKIQASGLETGGVHLGHVHGLSANGQPVESTCPTIAQDTDSDGFVELAEGAAKYGPILVDFMNADPDGDGRINFSQTFDLSGAQSALPLEMRHIVIHGLLVGNAGNGTTGEVNGTPGYKTVLPVLCGEIKVTGLDPLKFRKPS